jgi:WD40 repeat protein
LNDLGTVRVPDYQKKIESPLKDGSFLGVAFHPSLNYVFLSGGDNGTVIVYDYVNLKTICSGCYIDLSEDEKKSFDTITGQLNDDFDDIEYLNI